jgi:hypothetical protein
VSALSDNKSSSKNKPRNNSFIAHKQYDDESKSIKLTKL